MMKDHHNVCERMIKMMDKECIKNQGPMISNKEQLQNFIHLRHNFELESKLSKFIFTYQFISKIITFEKNNFHIATFNVFGWPRRLCYGNTLLWWTGS
jgi:hypothetical protein